MDDIFKTNYSKKVVAIRNNIQLNISDILNSIANANVVLKCNEYIIAPSTEALNRFILEHIGFFENKQCVFPTIEKRLYEEISDKYSFEIMCKDFKINTPKEHLTIQDASFPFVAKPKQYFSVNQKIYAPIIVNSDTELKRFLDGYNQEDFYFQEYVGGKCIYLLYYFYKNHKIDKFSQENFLQQEKGKSMLVAKSSDYHNFSISNKFERLFSSISFRGFVMIELKYHNNEFFMIEANPRFWGPSQLFVDAGVNLFESFLIDYGILKEKTIVKNEKKATYFWDDGVSENFEERKGLAYYNYTEREFKEELPLLNKIEIFNKKDTINLCT
jgi:predicted ATP-grasp superfamily ATP-dependent carboligase